MKNRAAIYTSESRSLACLENLAQRSGLGPSDDFRVLVIDVPENLVIETVRVTDLPETWRSLVDPRPCQQIAEDWLVRGEAPLLRVPSVIIPEENNVVINTMHPDFRLISVREVLPFLFDPRMAG